MLVSSVVVVERNQSYLLSKKQEEKDCRPIEFRLQIWKVSSGHKDIFLLWKVQLAV